MYGQVVLLVEIIIVLQTILPVSHFTVDKVDDEEYVFEFLFCVFGCLSIFFYTDSGEVPERLAMFNHPWTSKVLSKNRQSRLKATGKVW